MFTPDEQDTRDKDSAPWQAQHRVCVRPADGRMTAKNRREQVWAARAYLLFV
jgi:hypothetical protein